MYNTAIIGAGQLGSRHLQGLKTASLPLNIWVMDNDEESLRVAEERYSQVAMVSEKYAQFVMNIDQLPSELDFVVVATGSRPRATVVRSLLTHAQVKNLVLEKVLFTTLEDYDEICDLIKEKNVNCWVNCTRRMFGINRQIEESLDKEKPIKMKYEGLNWGLCCNSIHFIDLFMMFTGEKTYKIDTTGLEKEIVQSKRNGYIEMNGTLKITTSKGNELELTCHSEGQCDNLIEISNGGHVFKVSDAKQLIEKDGEEKAFHLPYQSELTGLVVDMILKTGYCPLSTLEKSINYHKPFIKALLSFYNDVNHTSEKMLPIT